MSYSFVKLTNESWVWGIFTSGSHALGICMSFVSTRDWETKHHSLCHRVNQIVRRSAPRPRCCSECVQLPLQFPSLCHSEHSSTQPSLTLGLRLSSSGRILIFCGMWLQTFADSLLLVLRDFQEDLWTFSWIPNIPKNSGVPGDWISAIDGHGSLFWKSHLAA